jgi:hypothetical protein
MVVVVLGHVKRSYTLGIHTRISIYMVVVVGCLCLYFGGGGWYIGGGSG